MTFFEKKKKTGWYLVYEMMLIPRISIAYRWIYLKNILTIDNDVH
jgi:hypothetical protein